MNRRNHAVVFNSALSRNYLKTKKNVEIKKNENALMKQQKSVYCSALTR